FIGHGRTSSRERGGDLKDRKDSEGRKVETSEESDGGTHSDAGHHIRGTRRATRKERVDGEEGPDHRERKRSGRSNREGRQDQEEEGRGDRSPVRIGRVDQVTEGTIGPGNQNPQENRRVGPEVLTERFTEREDEDRHPGGDEDQRLRPDFPWRSRRRPPRTGRQEGNEPREQEDPDGQQEGFRLRDSAEFFEAPKRGVRRATRI